MTPPRLDFDYPISPASARRTSDRKAEILTTTLGVEPTDDIYLAIDRIIAIRPNNGQQRASLIRAAHTARRLAAVAATPPRGRRLSGDRRMDHMAQRRGDSGARRRYPGDRPRERQPARHPRGLRVRPRRI